MPALHRIPVGFFRPPLGNRWINRRPRKGSFPRLSLPVGAGMLPTQALEGIAGLCMFFPLLCVMHEMNAPRMKKIGIMKGFPRTVPQTGTLPFFCPSASAKNRPRLLNRPWKKEASFFKRCPLNNTVIYPDTGGGAKETGQIRLKISRFALVSSL